jgi:hypothetical protein
MSEVIPELKPDDVGNIVNAKDLQIGDIYYTKYDKNMSHAIGPTGRSPVEIRYMKERVKSKSESGSINNMYHPNHEFFASKANPPGLRLTQARKASLANPPKVFTKPHGGRTRRRKTRRRKTRHRR